MGKFQVGNKGKPIGAISKKTIAWQQLGQFITAAGAARVKNILSTCDDETFMKYYPMLLEYFQPKLSRQDAFVEQNTNIQQGLTISVINPEDVLKIDAL